MSHPFFKPLSLHPDSEDYEVYKKNACPELFTKRLRELVPLLNITKIKIVKIDETSTELEMPLLEEAMNQNGTHQASVLYLIADYTAGVGIFGALPGVYVTGIHDRCHAYPVQYWLKSGKVVHLKPGLKKMTATTSISPENALRMRSELIQKGVTELEVNVDIYENGIKIAYSTHIMGLYGDFPRFNGGKVNMFQSQNAMLSANMIAGLKTDPLSSKISNGLGKFLANRFIYNTPELPEIVKSREISLRKFYSKYGDIQQVLILGLGLDTWPNYFSNRKWFGVDLRASIKQRRSIFDEQNIDDSMVEKVSADLLSPDWFDKLARSGFVIDDDCLVVMEGICMYLNSEALRAIFDKIASGMKSDNVYLWLDYVSDSLYETNLESANNFLENISRLGEPFISSEKDLLNAVECLSLDLSRIDKQKSRDYISSGGDIFDLYGFMEIPMCS